MASVPNDTGCFVHGLLFPEEDGRWVRRQMFADYDGGRLLRLSKSKAADPPTRDGYTGQLHCIATITKMLVNGLVESAKAKVVTLTFEEGRLVSETDQDVDLRSISGVVC